MFTSFKHVQETVIIFWIKYPRLFNQQQHGPDSNYLSGVTTKNTCFCFQKMTNLSWFTLFVSKQYINNYLFITTININVQLFSNIITNLDFNFNPSWKFPKFESKNEYIF